MRWLDKRASAVHSLRLRGSGDTEGALVPVTERRQPADFMEQPRIHDFTRHASLHATPSKPSLMLLTWTHAASSASAQVMRMLR